jgi:Fe-S oxidoreductase
MITAGFLRAKAGHIPGRDHGEAECMRIALFVTCLADPLYPDVGRATVALLERLGHQVEAGRGDRA